MNLNIYENMSNQCSTLYAVVGEEQELRELHRVMRELQDMREPRLENGFGPAWLGCLVDALGGDWQKTRCRGEWHDLELADGVLRFSTETAWSPCEEVMRFIQSRYPSTCFYYKAEEPGLQIFESNDTEGRFFPERYLVDMLAPDGSDLWEYYTDMDDALEAISRLADRKVDSRDEVERLNDEWTEEDAFCYLHEFDVVWS
jgi:hypothetical protein